jgi:chromosomal replication initiation ATPase DnaA
VLFVSQLTFDLKNNPALDRGDFIVSKCNEDAIAWIDKWPDWPRATTGLNVFGASASGKTHLGSVWKNHSNAVWVNDPIIDPIIIPEILGTRSNVVIDGFDNRWPGVPILHLYNLVREREGSILIITSEPVSRLGVMPADLASRLATLPIVEIRRPDDDLIKGVMNKLFRDRQIMVASGVLDYLLLRMERSFSEALRLVNLLDSVSLSENNAVTLSLARKMLNK